MSILSQNPGVSRRNFCINAKLSLNELSKLNQKTDVQVGSTSLDTLFRARYCEAG